MARYITIILATLSLFVTQAHSKPNVVVFLSDDQGWGDLSLNGNTNLDTPNIDSLAADGAQFDRFFVCPVCSPTRAEFLTGRYHSRSGVYSTSAGGERLNLDERTIGDAFKAAGYATAAFGKWHNGMQYPYHPNGRGFDEYYGFASGHWGDYFSPPLEHNGKIVQGEGFIIDDLTDHALDFIEAKKDQPFFIYLPYNTPHSPMQVPDRWWNEYKDRELKLHNREPEKEDELHVRCALAMCANIDWNVGRVLEKLDELDLAEDTIVLYFNDNGPNGTRWNGDMKGRKGNTDEGGVRSPLVIRWPAKIKPGTEVSAIAGAIDLLPTLAGFAGIEVGNEKPLDGVSLVPLLTGSDEPWPHADRLIFSHWKGRLSARSQQYRLDKSGALFDIAADPGQRADIAKQKPDIHTRLQKALDDWTAEVLPGLTAETDQRPFIIGHPDAIYTQLPARDAVVTGKIKRSNKFPNCSFFRNWVDPADTISFVGEVPADGRFEVELHYACPKADIGSTLELSFGDAKLTAKLTGPHDPPLRGMENDRTEGRAESYVKDFKATSLGTIDLKKGSGPLTLRAVEMPGSQVMEFRLLLLKRVE